MDQWVPVLVAVITTIGTIASAALGARWLSRKSGEAALANLQLLAETAEQKATMYRGERDELAVSLAKLQAAHAAEVAAMAEDLRLTRRELESCHRERDNLYSELRGVSYRRLQGEDPGAPRHRRGEEGVTG